MNFICMKMKNLQSRQQSVQSISEKESRAFKYILNIGFWGN